MDPTRSFIRLPDVNEIHSTVAAKTHVEYFYMTKDIYLLYITLHGPAVDAMKHSSPNPYFAELKMMICV